MALWQTPEWLKKLEPFFEETAGEPLETLMAHYGHEAISVLVQRGRDARALLANTQVGLLVKLRAAGLLKEVPVCPQEAPPALVINGDVKITPKAKAPPMTVAEKIAMAKDRYIKLDDTDGMPLTIFFKMERKGEPLSGDEADAVEAFEAGVLAAQAE